MEAETSIWRYQDVGAEFDGEELSEGEDCCKDVRLMMIVPHVL